MNGEQHQATTPASTCVPAPMPPMSQAITELTVVLELTKENHDYALSQGDYVRAAQCRERADSMRRAIVILSAYNEASHIK